MNAVVNQFMFVAVIAAAVGALSSHYLFCFADVILTVRQRPFITAAATPLTPRRFIAASHPPPLPPHLLLPLANTLTCFCRGGAQFLALIRRRK